jgi:hypothetical protein
VQVDGDGHRGCAEVHLGAILRGGAGPAHPHAVDRDVDRVGFEERVRGAHGGEDAAPVRVVAEQRGLDQVVAGDRAADRDRVVLVLRADDLDGDLFGRALGVGEQLLGEVVAGGGHRRGELLR